jgi:hypothetical protein
LGTAPAFATGNTQLLAENLNEDDTIINLNYDLLMDQALMFEGGGPSQYKNFHLRFLGKPLFEGGRTDASGSGLYLKLHGSLNWFVCTNSACPRSNELHINSWIEQCNLVSAVGKDFDCDYCRGNLSSLIIPPLLNKPIMQDRVFRNIWAMPYMNSHTPLI